VETRRKSAASLARYQRLAGGSGVGKSTSNTHDAVEELVLVGRP
jgi:hypothetical protein